MKKTTILLTLVLVVGIALAAWAGATKIDLYLDTQQLAGQAEAPGASGFVIVNENPRKTVIQFQVRGLTAGERYWAYYFAVPGGPHKVLGELKMNNFGSGHLHVNFPGTIASTYWLGVCDTDENPVAANQVLRMSAPIT